MALPTITSRATPLLAAGLVATALALVAPQQSYADTTPVCDIVTWDGATAAGQDRAYRVAPPAATDGATNHCYVDRTAVTANNTRPIHLVAGYQLDDRSGDGGVKSLVYVQIQCFDEGDNLVFKQSVASNLWDGAGQTGYYPRALFYPPSAGTFDCGIRVVNAYMGQPPRPVYVLSGYLNQFQTTNAHGQDDSTDPAIDPPEFSNGSDFIHMPLGSRTELRRVQMDVPDGVNTIKASSNVNYTECSWGTAQAGKCPPGSYDSETGSRHRLRIVAWQTMPGSTKVCRYLAGPDAAVPWHVVRGNSHHKGLKVDADLTMSDDPACSRTVVIKTVLEMGADPAYDSGFAASQFTVLSVYGG